MPGYMPIPLMPYIPASRMQWGELSGEDAIVLVLAPFVVSSILAVCWWVALQESPAVSVQRALNKLKRVATISKAHDAQPDGDDDECPICLERFGAEADLEAGFTSTGDVVDVEQPANAALLNTETTDCLTLNGCGHRFHAECLATWFAQYHYSCPMCRNKFWPPVVYKGTVSQRRRGRRRRRRRQGGNNGYGTMQPNAEPNAEPRLLAENPRYDGIANMLPPGATVEELNDILQSRAGEAHSWTDRSRPSSASAPCLTRGTLVEYNDENMADLVAAELE
ncbi:hypothetical protein F4808DRAFT_130135 [Astrocystis sublimbata]|nr:hypothetical protein F4808DRAFT_130135 [Astrocystis sublimbata]